MKQGYNREARKILYELGVEMVKWDDVALEYYFNKPAAKVRRALIKSCNNLALTERERQREEYERKMREIEDNLPF